MPDALLAAASLDAGTIAFLGGTVLVAGIWTLLPFSIFGVRGRLDAIEEAKRSQTQMLVEELRRVQSNLAAPYGRS